MWSKQQTQLTPAHGLPQLQPAMLRYLQINLPPWGIQAGLSREILQLGFPQWVSPGSHRGVAGCGGPWVGLVVGDLVGAICPPSLGVVQTWTGVVTGGHYGGGREQEGKRERLAYPFPAWKLLEFSTVCLLKYASPHLAFKALPNLALIYLPSYSPFCSFFKVLCAANILDE